MDQMQPSPQNGQKNNNKKNPFKRRNTKEADKQDKDLDKRLFKIHVADVQPTLGRSAAFNVRLDKYTLLQDLFLETFRPFLRDDQLDFDMAVEAYKRLTSFLITVKINNANLDGRKLFRHDDNRIIAHDPYKLTRFDQLFFKQLGATTRRGGGVEVDAFPMPAFLTLPNAEVISITRERTGDYWYTVAEDDDGERVWQELPFQGYLVAYPNVAADISLTKRLTLAMTRHARYSTCDITISQNDRDGSTSQLCCSSDLRSWSLFPTYVPDLVIGHALGFGENLEGTPNLDALRGDELQALYVHEYNKNSSITKVMNSLNEEVIGTSTA